MSQGILGRKRASSCALYTSKIKSGNAVIRTRYGSQASNYRNNSQPSCRIENEKSQTPNMTLNESSSVMIKEDYLPDFGINRNRSKSELSSHSNVFDILSQDAIRRQRKFS